MSLRRSILGLLAPGLLSLIIAAPSVAAPHTAAASAEAAAPHPDAYLAGYAAAVIERELGLEVLGVEVEAGLATVRVESLQGVAPQRIAEAVARIDGIERAEVVEGNAEPSPAADTTSDTAENEAAADDPGEADEVLAEAERDEPEGRGFDLFPAQELFDPLIADPRQPHFSAGVLWYLNDEELSTVGSANFGETFALLGGELGEGLARWEIGLLGAVFSIFDLDAPSSDLVNSDFWVAPTISLRRDGLSAQLRVYHQSSHLGDEFLLRNRTERVNLSYEGVDLLISADVHPALRVYAGGGAIVNSEPDLAPFSAQIGAELTSTVAFIGDHVRPLAAVDFQIEEENRWDGAVSAMAGIQLESPRLSRLRMQLLAEYYRGRSPNGQFYARRIEYVGVGAHLHF